MVADCLQTVEYGSEFILPLGIIGKCLLGLIEGATVVAGGNNRFNDHQRGAFERHTLLGGLGHNVLGDIHPGGVGRKIT